MDLKSTPVSAAQAALTERDVNALLAFHRTVFGGWRMADDPDTGSEGDEGDTPDDTSDDETDESGDADDAPADDAADTRLKKARDDAAKQRIKAREATTRLATVTAALEQAIAALKGEKATGGDKQTPDTSAIESELADLRLRDAIRTAADKKHVDAAALLDSRSFHQEASGLDVEAADFTDQLEALVAKAGKPATRTGKAGTPLDAGSDKDTPSLEEFIKMGYKKRAELYKSDIDLYRKLSAEADKKQRR